MKFPALIFLSAIFFIPFACKQEKKVTPAITQQTDTSASELPASSDKIYRGLFVVGKDVLRFRDCDNSEIDLAVIDSTGQMNEVYKSVFLHSPAFPNEYVYIEVQGSVSAADENTVPRGLDSVLTVKKILSFQQKSWQNSCIPYDFWAIGKEWSLQVSQKEGIIVFKDYAAMKVNVFEYFVPKVMGEDARTYASNNYAAQASIKAVIRRGACESGSSDSGFEYSASVLINGKKYKGCAIKGSSSH